MNRLLSSLAADPITAECQELLLALKDRCPGVLSPDPLPPGGLGPLLPVPPDQADQLYRLMARQLSGLPDVQTDPASPPAPGIVVWSRGDDELGIVVEKIATRLADGVIAVDIPVVCDEIGDGMVRVRFAVGRKDRPAGDAHQHRRAPVRPGRGRRRLGRGAHRVRLDHARPRHGAARRRDGARRGRCRAGPDLAHQHPGRADAADDGPPHVRPPDHAVTRSSR